METIINTCFYDTNAILELQDKVFDKYFVISSISLQELESIKTSSKKDEETKYKARKILHLLDENKDKYDVVVYSTLMENIIICNQMEVTPDTKIIASCVHSRELLPDGTDYVFITNDISCRMIASEVFGITVGNIDTMNNHEIYKGYKTIHGNTDTINSIMANIDYSEWNINEYLIIENTDDGISKEMRYDGSTFVPLKLPASRFIKGKNSLQ
nr:MAG TPA: PIN domain [Caudoviricetes sp.]